MSTHCDLGSRYPLERCPTRIDKKSGYQEPEKVKVKKAPIIAPGKLSMRRVAVLNGITPQNLRSLAIKLFRGMDFSDGITPEKAEILVKKYIGDGYKR
jgi:hypothetical protein